MSARDFKTDSVLGIILTVIDDPEASIAHVERLLSAFSQTSLMFASFYEEYSAQLLKAAVTSDKTDIVNFLLKKGAKINAQDTDGNTPLHFAEGNQPMIDLLIANGADKTILNNEQLALQRARQNAFTKKYSGRGTNYNSPNGIEMKSMKKGGSRRAKGRGRSRARTTKRKQTRKY